MRVRDAAHDDVDALVSGNVAIARETEGVTLDAELVRLGVLAVLDEPAYGAYLVAEREELVVGQLLVTTEWSDWRAGFYWWIQSVYVAPAARRLGVYRALHDEVVARARRAGNVLAVKLYVDRDNRRARAAYEALGMRLARYDLYELPLAGE